MAHQDSDRPRIEILPDRTDHLLTASAWLGLVALVGLTGYFYDALPDRIPTHFGLKGSADAWGPKTSLWIFVAIMVANFLLLTYVIGIPHRYNYIARITPENAENQYRFAVRTLRLLRAVVACLGCVIVWSILSVAQGKATGINPYVIIGFALMIVVVVFYSIWKSSTLK